MRSVEQLKMLIFDLDGVITSEKKYWQTARLTVWELICSEEYLGISQYFGESKDVTTRLGEVGGRVIPDSFIYELKSRAINSNWDLTFFVVCLHLVAILHQLKQVRGDFGLDILTNEHLSIGTQLHQLGKLLPGDNWDDSISEEAIALFWQETKSLRGTAVLEEVPLFARSMLGLDLPSIFEKGDLWQLCYEGFQDWYEGKKGYSLPDDETVLDLSSIDGVLKALKESDRYTLAIATGRPRNEVIEPLAALGLLQYFHPQRIVTYDEVLAAESILSAVGNKVKLGKPHPFVVFKACFPDEKIEVLCQPGFQLANGAEIAYIGDAGSDVVAAKRAGCFSIGVLTGFAAGKAREKKGKMLADLGCDVILDSILQLKQLLQLN